MLLTSARDVWWASVSMVALLAACTGSSVPTDGTTDDTDHADTDTGDTDVSPDPCNDRGPPQLSQRDLEGCAAPEQPRLLYMIKPFCAGTEWVQDADLLGTPDGYAVVLVGVDDDGELEVHRNARISTTRRYFSFSFDADYDLELPYEDTSVTHVPCGELGRWAVTIEGDGGEVVECFVPVESGSTPHPALTTGRFATCQTWERFD